MLVSFDFDGTLHSDGVPLWPAIARLQRHAVQGDRVLIVTTRTESHELPAWWRLHDPQRVVIADFIARHRLPVREVLFTAHELKAATLIQRGIDLHYDNDPAEIAAASAAGVPAILLNEATLHV